MGKAEHRTPEHRQMRLTEVHSLPIIMAKGRKTIYYAGLQRGYTWGHSEQPKTVGSKFGSINYRVRGS